MADDVVQDAFAGDSGGDPLVDNGQDAAGDGQALDGQSEDQAGQQVVDQDGQQVVDQGGNQPIAGTPFTSQAALVDGYKNIQRLAQRQRDEITNLQSQVDAALQSIRTFFGEQQAKKQDQPNKLPEGQELWDAFAKDPSAVIRQFAEAQVREALGQIAPRLQGMEQRVSTYEQQQLVQSFLLKHPDFTEDDENAVVAVLQMYPQLKQLPNGLDMAYDTVLAMRYRQEKKQASTENAVAGAKSIAGLGGKKTSVPAAKKPAQDPFDEVLNMDREQNELFRMGKKA